MSSGSSQSSPSKEETGLSRPGRGIYLIIKGGHGNFFVCPQNANPQVLGLIPQSKISKLLRCANPQIANLQICKDSQIANRKSASFLGVPVRKSQIHKFAKKREVFLIQIRIG
jgi:hypothetical protein